MTHLCIYEYEILNEFGVPNKLVNLIKLTLQGSNGKSDKVY
jgi:hypothetical protein